MKGWIKLFRDLLDWEWYQDINATRLLVHLLLTVNYQEKKWKGNIVKPGSIILSWETLSNSVGLSVQQCRTAMDKLIDSKEVTKRSTNKYQVITLVKWEEFQLFEVEDNKQNNSQITGQQQSNNNQITTTKESKESKEVIKNINKEKKGNFRPPTKNQILDFMLEKGLSELLAEKESSKFFSYYESIGWKVGKNKMKIWKSSVTGWINRMEDFSNLKTKDNGQNETRIGSNIPIG